MSKPDAKPKKQTRLELFHEAMTHDEAFEIARVFVGKALQGDDKAFDKVMDGFYGKLADKLEATVTELGPNASEVAARYAARVAAPQKTDT